jgi:hypothetical protein
MDWPVANLFIELNKICERLTESRIAYTPLVTHSRLIWSFLGRESEKGQGERKGEKGDDENLFSPFFVSFLSFSLPLPKVNSV